MSQIEADLSYPQISVEHLFEWVHKIENQKTEHILTRRPNFVYNWLKIGLNGNNWFKMTLYDRTQLSTPLIHFKPK